MLSLVQRIPFSAIFNLINLNGSNGFSVNGINEDDFSGSAISSGDLNRDHITDLLITAYGATSGSYRGQSYVIFGSKKSFPVSFDLSSLNGNNGFAVNGLSSDDGIFGISISSGDVNNDHINDLLIGAPYAPRTSGNQGQTYVLFGQINYTFDHSTTNYISTAASQTSTTVGQTSTTAIYTTTSFSSTIPTITAPSPSSKKNNQVLLIGAIAGSVTGILCIGGISYVLWKRFRKTSSLVSTSDLELQDSSIAIRQDKSRTIIVNQANGHRYALINKIKSEEAGKLFQDTGIQVSFVEGERKAKFILGEGQFGKVRLARFLDSANSQQQIQFVGVKKIKGKEKIEASRNEALLQFQLKGRPNIMPLLDSVDSKSSADELALYQFMPLAGFGNGRVLKTKLAWLDDISLKNKILVHTAKALLTGNQAMHELQIYHLDNKPDNFVIYKEGKIEIIDFGCAIQVKNPLVPKVNGDTRYFSPERLQCSREQTQNSAFDASKADAWALGVTLWELAIGDYPFDKETKTLDRIKLWDGPYFEEKLKAISDLKTLASEGYMELVKGLLNPDATKRVSLAEALDSPIFNQQEYRFSSDLEQQEAFKMLMTITSNRKKSVATSSYSADAVQYVPKEKDENYIYYQ